MISFVHIFSYIKRNMIVVIAAVIAIAIIFSAVLVSHAPAQSGTLPFGGLVLARQWCDCSSPGSAVLTVGEPRPGRFMYVRGTTKVFEYRRIPVVGVWLLGNYIPAPNSPPCLQWVGKSCVGVPHEGAITIVGTSR